MELQFGSLQNNQFLLKEILDNIDFHSRVMVLRRKYPYINVEGVSFSKVFTLPDKKMKYEIIGELLKFLNIEYDLSKKERLFSMKKYFGDYLMYYHIEVDEVSIGGHFAIYKYNTDYENIIIAGSPDSLLKNMYTEEIQSYRYCAINTEDVKDITMIILKLFDDIFDEFKRRLNV